MGCRGPGGGQPSVRSRAPTVDHRALSEGVRRHVRGPTPTPRAMRVLPGACPGGSAVVTAGACRGGTSRARTTRIDQARRDFCRRPPCGGRHLRAWAFWTRAAKPVVQGALRRRQVETSQEIRSEGRPPEVSSLSLRNLCEIRAWRRFRKGVRAPGGEVLLWRRQGTDNPEPTPVSPKRLCRPGPRFTGSHRLPP